MAEKRKSGDPIVKTCSISKFFEICDYFLYEIYDLWDGEPDSRHPFFKFTESQLVALWFKQVSIHFGEDFEERPAQIVVAERDGKTEYDLLDQKIGTLKARGNQEQQVKKLQYYRNSLPPFEERRNGKRKAFSEYLVRTRCKTTNENLKNKYIVFDVETNGLRVAKDDLLSLSILDPSTGMCYHRYFPLDLQPLVITTSIHGITDDDLLAATHITQSEMDEIIAYFHLKDRILLSYSGGEGLFDKNFVVNYCERHQVHGFEDLTYENIKSSVPTISYEIRGQVTKDNLCKLLNVKGVRRIHSGLNDCILQWKLFEQLKTNQLFFIKERLYKFNPEYVIPVTYLNHSEELAKYAGISVPKIEAKTREVFHYAVPRSVVRKIRKFPTNITGIALENAIDYLLSAKKQNNREFLSQNKKKLECLGSFASKYRDIPMELGDDGTLKAVNENDEVLVEEINASTELFMDNVSELIEYIKDKIFVDEEVLSQELCFSENEKVLALCDLSSKTAVIEVKTCNIYTSIGTIDLGYARQLFYQSHGRKTYILYIDFDIERDELTRTSRTTAINLYLHEVTLTVQDDTQIKEWILSDKDIAILKMLIDNPYLSCTQISRIIGENYTYIRRVMHNLELCGYIYKKQQSRKEPWQILRPINDSITYYCLAGGFHIVEKPMLQDK